MLIDLHRRFPRLNILIVKEAMLTVSSACEAQVSACHNKYNSNCVGERRLQSSQLTASRSQS